MAKNLEQLIAERVEEGHDGGGCASAHAADQIRKLFKWIRENLILVSGTEGAQLTIDESPDFLARAIKYEKMMKDVSDATLVLQTRKLTLLDSRLVLESLLESVAENRDKPGSTL